MAITLTAVQCPAVQVPAANSWVQDAFNTTGLGLLSGCPFPAADNTNFVARLNKTTKRIELLGRFGGGGYAICQGLGISIVTGVEISVAAGQAMADGIIENYTAQTRNVDNVDGRAWIWMQQAQDTGGSILPVITPVTNGVLTPPASNCVLLGSVVVTAGALSGLDTSGVMYLSGGHLYRQTADVGMPGDTPPAGIMFRTITAGGVYEWTGTKYLSLNADSGNVDTLASAVTATIPTGSQLLEFGPTKTYGRLIVYGRKRVIA